MASPDQTIHSEFDIISRSQCYQTVETELFSRQVPELAETETQALAA